MSQFVPDSQEVRNSHLTPVQMVAPVMIQFGSNKSSFVQNEKLHPVVKRDIAIASKLWVDDNEDNDDDVQALVDSPNQGVDITDKEKEFIVVLTKSKKKNLKKKGKPVTKNARSRAGIRNFA